MSGQRPVCRTAAKKARVWGWPAVANFILGGAGAGLYLFDALRQVITGKRLEETLHGMTALAAVSLVALGFISVAFEAGRPLRARFLLANIRNSWMSVEMAAGALFIAAATAGQVFVIPACGVIAAGAALVVVISHGCVLHRARAISAWRVPVLPFLFLTSALSMGGGTFLVTSSLLQGRIAMDIPGILMICLAADAIAWGWYLWKTREGLSREATVLLRRPLSLAAVMGLGQVLPGLLLLGLLLLPRESPLFPPLHAAAPVIGLLMAGGGSSQKILIILGSSFRRGLVMGPAQCRIHREQTSARDGGSQHFDRCAGISADSLRHRC